MIVVGSHEHTALARLRTVQWSYQIITGCQIRNNWKKKEEKVKGTCFKFILGNFHPPFGPGSTYREVISRRTFLRNLKFKSERNHAHTGRRPYGVLRVWGRKGLCVRIQKLNQTTCTRVQKGIQEIYQTEDHDLITLTSVQKINTNIFWQRKSD